MDDSQTPSEASEGAANVVPFQPPASEAEKKPRRGKATKSAKGEPAKFAPGDAAAPKEFEPAEIAERLHLWWEDGDGQTFIIGQDEKEVAGADGELVKSVPQVWSRWPEKKVVNLLREHWVRVKPREGEKLSEAERVLLYVMRHRRLDATFQAIPGYRAGIYNIEGDRVLVRTSPQLLELKPGEFPTVRALIEGKLNLLDEEGHGICQADYFHAWMKKAIESLYLGGPGNFQSGQCLVFAGPRDVGKSRIQHQVVTPLLGGRSADPSAYLFGKSDFNSEIFRAEHVMMEELEQTSQKAVDRVLFGERVKKLVTADRQRLHAKREDARMVEPCFRMTISINNDPDKLRLLFLLTPDIQDKVMLFLVSSAPLPMPANTLPERAAFRAQISAELPAYGHWLLHEYEIPEDLRHKRFGVHAWHHPALALELFDDTPAAELLALIDAASFSAANEAASYKLWDLKSHADEDKDEWEGTAIDLGKLLIGEGGWKCTVEREAKNLLMHHKCERLVGRLKEDRADRVRQHRTNVERRWVVCAPTGAR